MKDYNLTVNLLDPLDLRKSIVLKIRSEFEESKISKRELSFLSGVHRTDLSLILNGSDEKFTIDKLLFVYGKLVMCRRKVIK